MFIIDTKLPLPDIFRLENYDFIFENKDIPSVTEPNHPDIIRKSSAGSRRMYTSDWQVHFEPVVHAARVSPHHLKL